MIRNRAVYFLSAPEILDQIDKADLSRYLIDVTTTDTTIHGFVNTSALPMLLAQLRKDERFAEGKLFGLHTDVGAKLTDFRSYRGVLGEGSLQIVIDKETGRFYADCDKFNIYQDLVNVFGHSFGEVVPYFFRSVWSKFRKRKQLLKPIGSGDGNHIGTSE